MTKRTLRIEVTENAAKGLELLSVYAERHLLDKLYPNPNAAAIRTDLVHALKALKAAAYQILVDEETRRCGHIPSSENRPRGAAHDVRREQAARILKYYHLPFAVLELHGQKKVSYTFATTGVTITRQVTGGTEARPISRYYLGITDAVADDWADRMTAALMIARGIEPTMAMKVAASLDALGQGD